MPGYLRRWLRQRSAEREFFERSDSTRGSQVAVLHYKPAKQYQQQKAVKQSALMSQMHCGSGDLQAPEKDGKDGRTALKGPWSLYNFCRPPSQRSWRYTCSPQRKLWVRSSKNPQSPCSGRHKCFNPKHTVRRIRPHVCAEALRILLDSCFFRGVLPDYEYSPPPPARWTCSR